MKIITKILLCRTLFTNETLPYNVHVTHYVHIYVTERRERFNAANGWRPKSSGRTT